MRRSSVVMILASILCLMSIVLFVIETNLQGLLIGIVQAVLFACNMFVFFSSYQEGLQFGVNINIGKAISLDDLAKTDTGREFQVLSLHPAKTDADMLGVVRRMTGGEVRLVRGLFSGIEEGNLVILRADEGNGTGAAFVRVKDGLPPTEQQVADLSQMINETTGRSGQK